MSTVQLILAIAALVFAIVDEVQANGRSWAGWGVGCLAVYLLIGLVK